MMKNLIFFRKLFLIAQEKRPDALNATQKTPALYNVPFLKINKKLPKMTIFLKWLLRFFFKRFIQERYIAESSGLLRCIQCTRTLLLSSLNNIENFSKFSS